MRKTSALLTMLALALACGPVQRASAEDSSLWALPNTESVRAWNSGKDKDLSEWKTVDCTSDYGPRFVLTGLTGFREPSSNLDNFIAKLEATCTDLERTSTRTGSLFTSKNHRDSAYKLDALDWRTHSDFICPGSYSGGPFGGSGLLGAVEVGTNPGKDYIQNFRFYLRCVRIFTDDYRVWQSVGYSNQMIGESGYEMFDRAMISCPSDDYVVTGVQLRFEIGKGKIRELRLICRQLIYTPR